jgi:rare lipoprotein A
LYYLTKKIVLYIITISIFATLFSGCAKRRYYGDGYYNPSAKHTKSSKHSKASYSSFMKSSANKNIRNSPAMHRATMRPYKIAGKWYYPTSARVGDTFRGIASWYGPNFHAKKTSNGETYNMHALTAASKTLPMNTIVRADNLDNGKSIIVRINDRGPFVRGRIIDLSNKAAHAIDMVGKGTAKIKLTVLGFGGKIAKTAKEKNRVVSLSHYFVQVGAFRQKHGANVTERKFSMILNKPYKTKVKTFEVDGSPLYRVWISGFRSEDEARDFITKYELNGATVIGE